MFGPVKFGGPTRIRTEDQAIMSRIEPLSRPMSVTILSRPLSVCQGAAPCGCRAEAKHWTQTGLLFGCLLILVPLLLAKKPLRGQGRRSDLVTMDVAQGSGGCDEGLAER